MLGNEYSFFIFDFLLNLNKIAIFYIESGRKPKFIWALKYNTNKYTLYLMRFNSELKQTKGIRLFNKNKAL